MFKYRSLPNKIIIRTLKPATSPQVANKPKKTRWHNDYINMPFIYSLDRPHQYIDLNSRLITVEGNVGVGKEKFARKVADYFGLQFIDDVQENDLHVIPMTNSMQLDMRRYNDVLPRKAKTYTREMFWSDDDPIKYGKPLLLQLHHYYWRFWLCCRGMAHLFNTGQGMVTNRSPWTDNVMALALKECGLLSAPAYKFYNLVRCESIPTLWRPNIIIYLKASPDSVRKNLQQKKGWESTAQNLSGPFLEAYTNILEQKYLEDSALFSRVFTIDLNEYDVDNEDDFSVLMEAMAKLNCEFNDINEFDTLFLDWRNGTHGRDVLDRSRTLFTSAKNCFTKSFLLKRIPHSLSEGAYNEGDLAQIQAIITRDERYTSDPLHNSKFQPIRDRLRLPRLNYGNYDHTPTAMIARCWQ